MQGYYKNRYDPTKHGQCFNFTVNKKKIIKLRMDKQADISFFMVMLHPGGFFHGKRHVTDPKVLRISPLTAKTNEKSCVLTSAWDYNDSKTGTYFHFTCDLGENKIIQHGEYFDIILSIDPDKFIESYPLQTISVCSLTVFSSKSDCGVPDIPLHGSAQKMSSAPNITWIFSCDQG